MGDSLSRIKRNRQENREDDLSPEERRALHLVRLEAQAIGATLGQHGRGGVPSSLALGVYRRDRYQCKRCGTRDDLSLHHKGGIEHSSDSPKEKQNTYRNLVVICRSCHDAVHNEDRAQG